MKSSRILSVYGGAFENTPKMVARVLLSINLQILRIILRMHMCDFVFSKNYKQNLISGKKFQCLSSCAYTYHRTPHLGKSPERPQKVLLRSNVFAI